MTHIEQEKRVVALMIRLYCKHKEGNQTLCANCTELLAYAQKKLDHCKFGEQKMPCNKCAIHCYKPEMRTRIKGVMRYAGPRILFYHPIIALKHFLQ